MTVFWLVLIVMFCVLLIIDKRNSSAKIDRVVDDMKKKILSNDNRTVEEISMLRERYTNLAKMLGDDDIE